MASWGLIVHIIKCLNYTHGRPGELLFLKLTVNPLNILALWIQYSPINVTQC